MAAEPKESTMNFREKLARFLYGRYGADSLYNALFVMELILLFVGTVLNILGNNAPVPSAAPPCACHARSASIR